MTPSKTESQIEKEEASMIDFGKNEEGAITEGNYSNTLNQCMMIPSRGRFTCILLEASASTKF